MNVYIDESGIFSNPANKDNVASCAAALAIPSSQRKDIVKDFKQLTHRWRYGKKEVKGKELGESQIAEVVRLLKRYEVILDAVIMDLGLISDQDITAFRLKSADGMVVNLTPQHIPAVITQAHELRQAFVDMANPLFVQAAMMNILVPHLAQNIITYYSRRIPEELGTFHWIVDAKDKYITNFEKTWSLAIYPYILTHSLEAPLYMVEGGDYSYLERHRESEQRQRQIKQEHPEFAEDEVGALSIKKILGGGFKFQDSKTNICLQLVDVLANTIQRALNRKLDIRGWGEIGALMIHENPHPVQFILPNIHSQERRPITVKSPFSFVVEQFKRKAKSMWPS